MHSGRADVMEVLYIFSLVVYCLCAIDKSYWQQKSELSNKFMFSTLMSQHANVSLPACISSCTFTERCVGVTHVENTGYCGTNFAINVGQVSPMDGAEFWKQPSMVYVEGIEVDYDTDFGGFLYPVNQFLKWVESRDRCISYGGRLVKLDTQDKLNAVQKFQTVLGLNVWIDGHHPNFAAGTGCTTELQWADGNSIDVSGGLWVQGQPSGSGTECCLSIWFYNSAFGLDDNMCINRFPSLCEFIL